MSNTALKEIFEYKDGFEILNSTSGDSSLKNDLFSIPKIIEDSEQNPDNVVDSEVKIEIEKPISYQSNSTSPSLSATRNLEANFYCIIFLIDDAKKELEARVYEQEDKNYCMNIRIPFSSFSSDDILKIKINSIFYWHIGSKTTVVPSKRKGSSKKTVNFSEYRMRLSYVSKRAVQERIRTRHLHFQNAFSL